METTCDLDVALTLTSQIPEEPPELRQPGPTPPQKLNLIVVPRLPSG